jgi:hypothetical protein
LWLDVKPGVTSEEGTAYLSGPPGFIPVFSGVLVTRSLVLYICFVDRCLSFCAFSFGHCAVLSVGQHTTGPFQKQFVIKRLLTIRSQYVYNK